jgi:hypothetical protein
LNAEAEGSSTSTPLEIYRYGPPPATTSHGHGRWGGAMGGEWWGGVPAAFCEMPFVLCVLFG